MAPLSSRLQGLVKDHNSHNRYSNLSFGTKTYFLKFTKILKIYSED